LAYFLIVIGSSDLAMMDTLGNDLFEHDGCDIFAGLGVEGDGFFGSCHALVAAP
jgi:hypothetical protein